MLRQAKKKISGILLGFGLTLFVASCTMAPSVTAPVPVRDVVFTPAQTVAPLRQDIIHVVGPAETVYRISKMYDVSINAILRANRISDPRRIPIGRKLRIPQATPLRPVVSLFKTNKWRYIVIHHTATASGDAASIDDLHRRRGFSRGLGYHFLIDNGTNAKQDGQVEASSRWVKQMNGAHCNTGGMNERGIGIALIGDFTKTPPTKKQMDSLVLLVDTLRRYYRIPLSRIIRHKDVPGKSTLCPGYRMPWRELKRRFKRGR